MPETSTPPARTARLRHNGKTLTVYSVVVEARRSSLRPLDLAGAEKAASEALEWLQQQVLTVRIRRWPGRIA